MKILFRADSSSSIGLGHIMRDLVLAGSFKDDDISFACLDLDGNIIDKIPYKTHILESGDKDELAKLISKEEINMLVVDHYGIGYEYEKYIKEKTSVKIFVFDDSYERHFCDILLNHNISADEKRYKDLVPNDCELRCGAKYTLIRDEFKKEKLIQREKIFDIFISLGGADTFGLTQDILEMADDSKSIVVLSTSSNSNLNSLKEYVKKRKNITLKIDSNEVAKLMNESRFAIVTPSVMVHEVLYMGLDFASLRVALNQDEIHRYLKDNNYNTYENILDLKVFL